MLKGYNDHTCTYVRVLGWSSDEVSNLLAESKLNMIICDPH